MVTTQKTKVDHRWFIWTVLFLIVSGVSLVSYIMITNLNDDTALADSALFPVHHTDTSTQHTTKKK